MKDDETITFSKKELELIMGNTAMAIEFILLPQLEYWEEDIGLTQEELISFKLKLKKMCSL